MSEDRREQVLSRIFTILEDIKDFTTVVRNVDEMPERSRPCAVLIDGDERRSDTSQGNWESAYIVIMTPIIAIGVSSSPEQIGGDANALRTKVLAGILPDATLKSIVGKNGRIIYEGLTGKLSHGSLMACDAQLEFQIHYPLIVKNL